MGAICVEFQKNYKTVNLKFKNEDEKGYDYTILLLYLEELKKGYKAKRINKATKKGTTVTYSLINTKEELQEYINLLQVKVDEFNSKWDCDLQLFEQGGRRNNK